jgi:hypothetical protein
MVSITLIVCATTLDVSEWEEQETGSHAKPSVNMRTYALDINKSCIGRGEMRSKYNWLRGHPRLRPHQHV